MATSAAGNTESRTVDVNATRLHALLDGPEGAPWVVMIHALGTNSSLYDRQIPAFAQNFRILRYDLRGHGRSATPPGPYAMDSFVNDLVGLLAHFRIARTHLVGMSLGALTALAAAQRGLPQISSVVFCDARVDVSAEFMAAIDERNRVVQDHGMRAVAALMATRWLAPATVAGKLEVVEKVVEMVCTTDPRGFVASAEAIKGNRTGERLSAVKVPTLFVTGDQDPGLPKEVMHRTQVRVPGSEFSVLVGASHLSNLDQPHSFNKVVGDFLRRQK